MFDKNKTDQYLFLRDIYFYVYFPIIQANDNWK